MRQSKSQDAGLELTTISASTSSGSVNSSFSHHCPKICAYACGMIHVLATLTTEGTKSSFSERSERKKIYSKS